MIRPLAKRPGKQRLAHFRPLLFAFVSSYQKPVEIASRNIAQNRPEDPGGFYRRYFVFTLRSGQVARSLSLRLGLVCGPLRGPALALAPVQAPSLTASPRYFAYSIAFVSRIRFTLIWPGYSSSSSIFLAISRASSTMRSSLMASGLTMMRTSRPAWMA